MMDNALKTLFADDFLMGAAVGNSIATHADLQKERDLLAAHLTL